MFKIRIPHIFFGWWIVIASFIITLYVGGIIVYGFTAIFEPLIEEFHWSYTEVSFGASLRGLEIGIFAPQTLGPMIEKIKEHIAEVEAFATQSKEELESFRIKYLGKKGLLNDFFTAFKEIAKEEKKEFGQVVNRLK